MHERTDTEDVVDPTLRGIELRHTFGQGDTATTALDGVSLDLYPGQIVLLMGPSHTGYKDAPLILGGDRPNTTTGTFFVKKGRVQLDKPRGVDAISGDVIVGGQGFNDCLFWKHSDQLKDTVNITLLNAGNSGAAYLHLNGCSETAASLTMTVHNKIKTDAPAGGSGTLTVKVLTVGGVNKPAGTYSSATESWIEGQGKVIVRP